MKNLSHTSYNPMVDTILKGDMSSSKGQIIWENASRSEKATSFQEFVNMMVDYDELALNNSEYADLKNRLSNDTSQTQYVEPNIFEETWNYVPRPCSAGQMASSYPQGI